MENTQIVKLHNVNLAKLKTAFNRSLSIGSDALNFKITRTEIAHVAEHSSKSLYKKWSLPTEEAYERSEGDFTELKVAIFAGSEFVSKIFGFFGQLANFDIYHINGNVTKIELTKLDEKGKRILRIVLVTAKVQSSYIELDENLINSVFNITDPIATIKLTPEDLKQLNKLSTLTTNPESQTDYITIKTEDGQLVATDGAFDIALYDIAEEIDKIDIDKELFSCIEHENYEASIYALDADKKMTILTSKDSDSQIAVVLLGDADESTNWDEFSSDTNWDSVT